MDALERAAKAMWEAWPERIHSPWEKRHEVMKDESRREARAAILAFLDAVEPVEIARIMLEQAGMRSFGVAQDWREEVSAAVLAALRACLSTARSDTE